MKLLPIVLSLLFALTARANITISGASFPIPSPSKWYKITFYRAGPTTNYFGGPRPQSGSTVWFGCQGADTNGQVYFMPLGGSLQGHHNTNLYFLKLSPNFASIPCNGVGPMTNVTGPHWAIDFGSLAWNEWRCQRTATSMTFAEPAADGSLRVSGTWIVLEASVDPVAAIQSTMSSGTGEWDQPEIDQTLDYLAELSSVLTGITGGGGTEGGANLVQIREAIEAVEMNTQGLSSITPELQTITSYLDAIFAEMLLPSDYTLTRAGVRGTGSPVAFKDFANDELEPAANAARSTMGTFGDPRQGDPVAIPDGDVIEAPTVSETGMSFSVNMRELGEGFLPAGVSASVLPGQQTLAVSFGPVLPFINICRWLLIGLVTLFSAERIFSEFRRL
jgi:hypothetical protein